MFLGCTVLTIFLYSQFVAHVMSFPVLKLLYCYLTAFRSMYPVPIMAVRSSSYSYYYYYYYYQTHYYYHYPCYHPMQGSYNYIHETNHVSRVHSVAAVLYLQSVLHVMLFPMINVSLFDISTFRSLCAVRNMAVFTSSLISCFSGTLFRYCLNDFEMLTVADYYYYYRHHHHHNGKPHLVPCMALTGLSMIMATHWFRLGRNEFIVDVIHRIQKIQCL